MRASSPKPSAAPTRWSAKTARSRCSSNTPPKPRDCASPRTARALCASSPSRARPQRLRRHPRARHRRDRRRAAAQGGKGAADLARGIPLRRPRRPPGARRLRSALPHRPAFFRAARRSAGVVAAQHGSAPAPPIKPRRKLELDLAAYQGKELYATTAPGRRWCPPRHPPRGARQPGRTARHRAELHRAVEGRFVARASGSAFRAAGRLRRCRHRCRQSVEGRPRGAGGRGGGTARIAQGSVPNAAARTPCSQAGLM